MIESIVLKLCHANTHGKGKVLGKSIYSLRLYWALPLCSQSTIILTTTRVASPMPSQLHIYDTGTLNLNLNLHREDAVLHE